MIGAGSDKNKGYCHLSYFPNHDHTNQSIILIYLYISTISILLILRVHIGDINPCQKVNGGEHYDNNWENVVAQFPEPEKIKGQS